MDEKMRTVDCENLESRCFVPPPRKIRKPSELCHLYSGYHFTGVRVLNAAAMGNLTT